VKKEPRDTIAGEKTRKTEGPCMTDKPPEKDCDPRAYNTEGARDTRNDRSNTRGMAETL
jgi:hypothetical protein